MTRRRKLTLLLSLLVLSWPLVEATSKPIHEVKGGHEALRGRSLSSDVLPFTTEIQIEIDPNVDRQPTINEYSGVTEAASKWFTANTEEIYDRLSVYNTLCTVISAKWRPYITDEYSQTINMDCEITMVAHVNDRDAVPSIGQFLLDTSAHSSVTDLVTNYLQHSGESPSIFQYSLRATYASYERGSYQEIFTETNEASNTLASFEDLYAMMFDIDWNFVLQQERTASSDDYNFLVKVTQSWLTIRIEDYYNFPDAFRLRQVSTQLLGTPQSWEDTRHNMVVSIMVVWEANSKMDVPSPAEFLKDMSARFDLGSFLTNYLEKGEGTIFQNVQEVSYGTSYSNPNPDLALGSDLPIGTPVEGESLVSVSFNMTLTYGLNRDDFPFGKTPTQTDWQGLLQATQSFLKGGLTEHYNYSNATVLEDVTARWVKTQYRPWETIRPYRARLELTLFYSEGSLLLPAAYDYKFLIAGILGGNKDRYLSSVSQAEPDSNLFRSVERVNWGF